MRLITAMVSGALLMLAVLGCEAGAGVAQADMVTASSSTAGADMAGATTVPPDLARAGSLPDMTLEPQPLVPAGLNKISCAGFLDNQAIWGPDVNGSYIRLSVVDNHVLSRYEDSKGNVDSNCYDTTPVAGSFGGFAQGSWPYTYVIVHVAQALYVTKDGWTWSKVGS